MSDKIKSVPSVSVTYARNGASTKANALGMRPMQERAYDVDSFPKLGHFGTHSR